MADIEQLKFFSTAPHDCSYLDNQTATTIFADPNEPFTEPLYKELLSLGFRRSGSHIYRPHCQQCKACISVRIPCSDFKPKRQQRRIIRKNADLKVERVESIDNNECYSLFENYINTRHSDGDMHPTSQADYRSFLCDNVPTACYFRFTLNGQLIAVAISDQLSNGLSAVYSFFDPAHDKRSLGSYMILWQIKECVRLGLKRLYLGYWIKNCQKMSYKSLYRPLELYMDHRWQRLN